MSESKPETTNAFEKPDEEPKSIVDTILNLDELLSGDVRRATKTARILTKPHLGGELEEVEYELGQLIDDNGNLIEDGNSDRSLVDGGVRGRVDALLARRKALRAEMAASTASIRVEQLPDDEWDAFQNKHRDALAKGTPFPPALWDELIVKCAVAPRMTEDKVKALRKLVGHPQMDEIAWKCWSVCTQSGVSVPKSSLSSDVLKQLERAKS